MKTEILIEKPRPGMCYMAEPGVQLMYLPQGCQVKIAWHPNWLGRLLGFTLREMSHTGVPPRIENRQGKTYLVVDDKDDDWAECGDDEVYW